MEKIFLNSGSINIIDKSKLNKKERKKLLKKEKKDYEISIKNKSEQELRERILINNMTFHEIIKEIEKPYNDRNVMNDEDYVFFKLKNAFFEPFLFSDSSFINYRGKCNLASLEKLGYKIFTKIFEHKMILDTDSPSFRFKEHYENIYEGILDIDIYNKIMRPEKKEEEKFFTKEFYLIKGDDDNFSMFKMMNY